MEQTMSRARAALGNAGVAQAWDAGLLQSTDEAVADALARSEPLLALPQTRDFGDMPPQSEHRSTAVTGRGLSQRELEVLGLLCRRLTDAEIAEALFISTKTAGHHVSRILGKLGAANRREAAAIAAREQLV
jgi:DNA-binding NarL/FixJ family response regulator